MTDPNAQRSFGGEWSDPGELMGMSDLEDLLRSVFDDARASGKSDWNVMTVAVLKNRLLDRTGRQFSETDYGAKSITELVRRFPRLLALDDSVQPPRVTLRGDLGDGRMRSYAGRQIRPDLWTAMVDYTRGEPYVWTGDVAMAQSEYRGSKPAIVLPTISRDEELDWRTEFVDRESSALNDDQRAKLEAWRDRHLGSAVLPSLLQRRWNEELKGHLVDRLRKWFDDNGMQQPRDLIVPIRKPSGTPAHSELDKLRILIIKCVENMTLDELRELRLPPEALLRGWR